MASVWSDVPPNGIWETEDVEKVPWEDLTAPYAVIIMGEVTSADWGGDNAAYEIVPEIYYIGGSTGDSTAARAKIEALRDSLMGTNLPTAQVLDVVGLSHDNSLPPNALFAAKNYAHRAGRLRAQMLCGEVFPL